MIPYDIIINDVIYDVETYRKSSYNIQNYQFRSFMITDVSSCYNSTWISEFTKTKKICDILASAAKQPTKPLRGFAEEVFTNCLRCNAPFAVTDGGYQNVL